MSSMTFKKRIWGDPVLSEDQRSRQGRVVKSALTALGNAGALAFLNRHHDGLCGRPLDLAVGSDAGLAAVEAVLGADKPVSRRARETAHG